MGWEVGGKFKREGTYTYCRLIHVDVWQKPPQSCKVNIFQLKINKLKKNPQRNEFLPFMAPPVVCIQINHRASWIRLSPREQWLYSVYLIKKKQNNKNNSISLSPHLAQSSEIFVKWVNGSSFLDHHALLRVCLSRSFPFLLGNKLSDGEDNWLNEENQEFLKGMRKESNLVGFPEMLSP